MNVRFYLKEREVKKVLFKQFSSHCTIWLHLLSQHESELSNNTHPLKLKYHPDSNTVEPVYDPGDLLLKKIHGTAVAMCRSCYIFEQLQRKHPAVVPL